MTWHIDSDVSVLPSLLVVWGPQSGTSCTIGRGLGRPQTGHNPPMQLRTDPLNPSTGQRQKMQTWEKLC